MRAILCADRYWGIGKENGLLFSLPSDMKFFREKTKGKVVVMGARTLKSLPGGKPLKNRTNILLSTKEERDDCLVARNLEELFSLIGRYAPDDVFVIGGASVYNALIPYCDSVFVTRVDADGQADTFVNNLDGEAFDPLPLSEKQEENGLAFTFYEYINKVKKFF